MSELAQAEGLEGSGMLASFDSSWLIPGARPAGILRAAMSSLALGGAERIVAEWLGDEAASGRPAQLAIAHSQPKEMEMHPKIELIRRPRWMQPIQFWSSVGAHWASLDPDAPVAAHLLSLHELQALSSRGLGLIPVLHNDPAGWKGDPSSWSPAMARMAMGCAPFVAEHGKAVNPSLFWSSLRHRPKIPESALSLEARRLSRARFGASDGDFVVGMVGSIKAQKDYPKAVEVASWLGSLRRSKIVALGEAGPSASDLPRVLERARQMGSSNRFHWLGGSKDVGSFLAGVDALLSTSRHEGFPMAAMEALGAGIPVIAPDLPGFRGVQDRLLTLMPMDAEPAEMARALARLPARDFAAAPALAASNRRMWSIPFGARVPKASQGRRDVLFVTANLNAGGAQRSLANLLCQSRSLCFRLQGALGPIGALGDAGLVVCDQSPTHPEFSAMLRRAEVPVEALGANDPIRAAEALILRATERSAKAVVFWNADAKLKLLAAKFMPPSIAIIDVSPGDYAFEELGAADGWCALADFSIQEYSERLERWVSKRPCGPAWLGAATCFIPNGCPPALHPSLGGAPSAPRFIVSGRIAASKRLDVVLDAFALFKREHPEAQMHLAGQAEARCEDLARALMGKHGAAQGVHWLGADPSLSFYARPWSAQITLGTAQGSPNAVLESLAAGVPVLANDDGGTAYALGADQLEGAAGILLTEHPSPIELARAMEISLDPATQLAWRSRAAELSAGRHSMRRMVQSYADLIGQAVLSKDGSAP